MKKAVLLLCLCLSQPLLASDWVEIRTHKQIKIQCDPAGPVYDGELHLVDELVISDCLSGRRTAQVSHRYEGTLRFNGVEYRLEPNSEFWFEVTLMNTDCVLRDWSDIHPGSYGAFYRGRRRGGRRGGRESFISPVTGFELRIGPEWNPFDPVNAHGMFQYFFDEGWCSFRQRGE